MKEQIRRDQEIRKSYIWFKIIPVLIITAGAFWSSQVVAKNAGYSQGLGEPWFWAGEHPWYSPIAIIFWTFKWYAQTNYHYYFDGAYYPVSAATMVALVVYILAWRKEGKQRNSNLYGTAKFADDTDLARAGLFCASGIVCGHVAAAILKVDRSKDNVTVRRYAPDRLIIDRGMTSTILIAPPRSGKGVSSIIPTLCCWKGSVIQFDPKGENYEATAGFRRTFSHVLRFAPLSEESIRYNPLLEIRPGNCAFRDASNIADILIAPSGQQSLEGSEAAHFNEAAKDLLTGLIMHVVSCPYVKEKSIGSCLDIISKLDENNTLAAAANINSPIMLNFSRNGINMASLNNSPQVSDDDGAVFKKLMEMPRVDPAADKIVQDSLGRLLNKPPRERGSVISTAARAIWLFQDPVLRMNTSTCDFSLNDFMESDRPVSLYLTVPYSDIDRLTPVIRLFISFFIRRMSEGETGHNRMLKHRLLYLLDEFPVLGNFPYLEKTMAVLQGYGIVFFLVCQSVQQLNKIYGNNHSFFDQCKNIITYAPGDYQSAKIFSDIMGKQTIVKEQKSNSGSKYEVGLKNLSISSSEVQINLMNPDEIMHMSFDKLLLLSQGMHPYMGKKVIYYRDTRFRKRINPPIAKTREEQLAEFETTNPVTCWDELCNTYELPADIVFLNEYGDYDDHMDEYNKALFASVPAAPEAVSDEDDEDDYDEEGISI